MCICWISLCNRHLRSQVLGNFISLTILHVQAGFIYTRVVCPGQKYVAVPTRQGSIHPCRAPAFLSGHCNICTLYSYCTGFPSARSTHTQLLISEWQEDTVCEYAAQTLHPITCTNCIPTPPMLTTSWYCFEVPKTVLCVLLIPVSNWSDRSHVAWPRHTMPYIACHKDSNLRGWHSELSLSAWRALCIDWWRTMNHNVNCTSISLKI